MNDKFKKLLEYLLKTAKQTAAFASKEVPLLFKEVVRIHIIEYGVITAAHVLLGTVVLGLGIFFDRYYAIPLIYVPTVFTSAIFYGNAVWWGITALRGIYSPRMIVIDYVEDKLRRY